MLYTSSDEEELILMKRMWNGEPVTCPECGEAQLVHLHKKAKKSNNDWKCPSCGEIYRTIKMLNERLDRQK